MASKKSKGQKFYRMKGCSKKTKKYLGGSGKQFSNITLAYPTKDIFSVKNPALAYTGKGGSACSDSLTPSNLAYTGKMGPNSVYPNPGAQGPFPGWLNPSMQRGGGCGCASLQSGGGCSLCSSNIMVGGNHRKGCKCSKCRHQKGGNNGLPYGQNLPAMKGIPYPNGLTGQPWGADFKWPGTNNVSGDFNHYKLNNYVPDVSREMIATGSAPPFSVGGGKKTRKNRKQKGGNSNGLFQDFVNLGRQFTYGLGSAYNGLRGFNSPTNPMPWNGQLSNTPTLATVKASYI